MRVYCGDYMDCRPPRLFHWGRLGIIAACLLFTSAATPAMINYYWNGQNSTKNLALDEAIRMAQDESMPVHARRSAQLNAFFAAKEAINAIKASRGPGGLSVNSKLLLEKLDKIIEEGK